MNKTQEAIEKRISAIHDAVTLARTHQTPLSTAEEWAEIGSLTEYAVKTIHAYRELPSEVMAIASLSAEAKAHENFSVYVNQMTHNYNFLIELARRITEKAEAYERIALSRTASRRAKDVNRAKALVLRLQLITEATERLHYRKAIEMLGGAV